jgi:hypothetical protein
MANYALSYNMTFRDVDGQSTTLRVHNDHVADTQTYAATATTLASLSAAVAATTNAKLVQTSFTVLVTEASGVGTDAEFPLVSQKAVLHFSNAQGSRASLGIPAPKEAGFKAPPSDDIVDPAETNMAALIAAFIADAADAANNAYLFQGGALSSRHRSRRRSIHTA